MITRIWPAMLAILTFLALLPAAIASDNTDWIQYQNADGETVYLRDNRQPSLYTGNFGDCLGGSLVNVSRFDAAYYKDNMTVSFHLAGSSAIKNESLVMYIGVFAYGQSRFDLVFNPCSANIASLCPLNSSVPITANGQIPLAPSDVEVIPSLAYSIPDFEGQVILRIFANSTESEIGCYSAILTNGKSFGHPKSVGTVLGVFTLVTVIASFATAIYGEAVPTMRLHYAHSLSVGVVIAVFQHIFFTGALSVNWPSVLTAWWSNFAWAGGMIHSTTMQQSINHLIGSNFGNTSQVGAAPSDSSQDNLGGGYDISSIYKRALSRTDFQWPADHPLKRDLIPDIFNHSLPFLAKQDSMPEHVKQSLHKRDFLPDKQTGYKWYGNPVGPTLPLPGNYSGFAGTLARQNIPVANAFMTGLLWFLILWAILVFAVVAFKGTLEGLAKVKAVKQDRLKFFRDHWRRYTLAVGLRTCYIGFFLMMFLTIFEFTYQSSAGVKAVAAIVFFIFIIGISGAAWYACYYKKHLTSNDPNGHVERKKLLGVIPMAAKKARTGSTREKKPRNAFWKRTKPDDLVAQDQNVVDNIHDNDDYTMKFGWLASRFRRTRWWFFTVWIFYELLRAIFYGGASGFAFAQVFGLLIIEFLAFVYIIWARPFEGRRLNILVVYCLGFSKVASVALSAAFDVHFNLDRIITTVIGIVIIVIQGVLTIITMIAILVGAISSYMSVSRNHHEFRPRKWHGVREKYFDHLDRVANDLPREPKPKKEKKQKQKRSRSAPNQELEQQVQPGFEVKNFRRTNKIEDDDAEFASEMHHVNASYASLDRGTNSPVRISRAPSAASMSQSHLPFGARPHRPSWSTRDFSAVGYEDHQRSLTPVDISHSVPDDELVASTSVLKGTRHSRSTSLSSMMHQTQTPPVAPKPHASTDNLHIGGDVSSWDTIGRVPAPTVRARSNTHGSYGSARNSRAGTPVHHFREQDEGVDPQPGSSQYGSRHPLTPAIEIDEWRTPKTSQEDEFNQSR